VHQIRGEISACNSNKCYLVEETRSLKSKKYFIEGLTLALNCLNC